MQEQLNKRHHCRAVAPIIATLLMIAVTVVGGTLVFSFSQDFFTDTSTTSPVVDDIEALGYDARDLLEATTSLDSADGTATPCGVNVKDRQLDDDECFFVYVRNAGDAPVIIDEVLVFGETYDISTDSSIGTGKPALGDFMLLTDAGAFSGTFTINANNVVTIAITYEEAVTDEVKLGKKIPVTIITAQGATIKVTVISGVQRGGS